MAATMGTTTLATVITAWYCALLCVGDQAAVPLNQELASVEIPPGLLPARLEAAGAPFPNRDNSGAPANYGGCSEDDIPVVDNGVLQAASRLRAANGELSYQCLPGFQNDGGDKWTVRVACQFDPTNAKFGWQVHGACIPLKDEAKCKTLPTPPANARLPELDSVGGSMKFVPGARVYFDCREMFLTTANDGETPPFSECNEDGTWTPAMHECRLGQRIVADNAAKTAEIAKSAAEKHAKYFHSDDPSAADSETEAERLEHDAVIDRFVHLTNAKGLPHNEDMHRLVHHGPAADVAGADIENDFDVPDNVAFKKIAPGGVDLDEMPLAQNKARLRREERTLLALLKKQDEVLHPKPQRSFATGPAAKSRPKSRKATVRTMRENSVDYTDSQWADLYDNEGGGDVPGDQDVDADVQGDGPKPGSHVGVRNTDGRFEMMPNNPPRLHKYHSTVKADIDRRIRHAHQLGGEDRIVKTPRPRSEHSPYYVLLLVLGTFVFMVSGAGCLINHYGLLDMENCPDDPNPCPAMPKGSSVRGDQSSAVGDTENDDCGKPWWDFC